MGNNEELVALINRHFDELNTKISTLHIDMIGQKAQLETVHRDLEEMKKAFPKDEEGLRDYAAHNGFHDDYNTSRKNWSAILLETKKKVFSGVAWAAVLFLAYSVWEFVKTELKK